MFRRATTCCIVTGPIITMIRGTQFGVNSGTAHNGINATLTGQWHHPGQSLLEELITSFFKGVPEWNWGH